MEEIEVRKAKNYGRLELKIARLQTGLKQHELTAKVAITPTQLSEIETGRHKLPSELLE